MWFDTYTVFISLKPGGFYIPVYVMVVKLPCMGGAEAGIECHRTQSQWKWLHLRFSIWEWLLWKTSLKADEDDRVKSNCREFANPLSLFTSGFHGPWPTVFMHLFMCLPKLAHTQQCFPYSISLSLRKVKTYGMYYSVSVLIMCSCWNYLIISSNPPSPIHMQLHE